MTWKILWNDARRAAADGDFKRAAELFTVSMTEAQRMSETNDPNFQDFMQERNKFYQDVKNNTQSFQNIVAATPPDSSRPDPNAAWSVAESKTHKMCSRCGNTKQLCGCRAIAEASNTAPFEPGDLIAGRYQMMRVLGSGGMAVVYLVRNEKDKLFAMKILNGGVPDEQQATERFEREARLVKKMRHPNIISVFDFGKMADGRSYFVMEFVEGLSLLSVLESEYKLSMTRTCKIILQVCDAMAHAHQLGIIHRDLKPSNVILVSEDDKCDKVKIVDFGIAKLNEPWEGMESRLTQDGQVLGSPAYMSPEQCLGNPLDQRSDIYSVGCVMYQLLCGVPPFWGDHALAILYKQVNETTTAVDLPAEPISPGLEKIILKTLRKDPNDRYQSMTELESDLVKLMMQEARAQ